MKPLLVFDMDGVLVDVTDSYRQTIIETVRHFTGLAMTNEQIQDLKNQGGFNDDWILSHYVVTKAGVDVPFEAVKAHFQKLFLGGDGTPGMILRERWIGQPGLFERLSENYRLAVFTGRPKEEARITLDRFAPQITFEPVVGMYDVVNHKPAPDGLLQMDNPAYYIGDSIDDARSARAAGVPFIGICGPENPRYIDLVFLFQEEGAHAIVDDINYLEEVFQS